jgi:RNA polymerase sigma factor (sigma-70 family)
LLTPACAPARHDLEQIYTTHSRRLRALAASVTFDRAVADEIVHDAFVALTARCAHVENPVAYLQRSVINLAISHLRRRDRARVLPVHRVEHTAIPEVDAVWDVLAGLSARQRAVVVLRFYEDLSYDQIAVVLDIPMGSVKSTLHRALSTLKDQL